MSDNPQAPTGDTTARVQITNPDACVLRVRTPDPHAGSERETLRCPNPHCENGTIRGTPGVGCAVCSTGAPIAPPPPFLPASEHDRAKLDRLIFDYHDAEDDETGTVLAAFTAVADFARALLSSRDGVMRSLVEHQQKELRALLAAPSPSEERAEPVAYLYRERFRRANGEWGPWGEWDVTLSEQVGGPYEWKGVQRESVPLCAAAPPIGERAATLERALREIAENYSYHERAVDGCICAGCIARRALAPASPSEPRTACARCGSVAWQWLRFGGQFCSDCEPTSPSMRPAAPTVLDWSDTEGLEEAILDMADDSAASPSVEPPRNNAWLALKHSPNLKQCPWCGELALEGEEECSECGARPTDDVTWRNASAAPVQPEDTP